jgi:hypothetical protein
MPQLQYTLHMNASPERAWAVVGDLAGMNTCIPGIVSTTVEESERFCTDAAGNAICEQISDYSETHRAYRYAHLQVPLPVQDSHGLFSVMLDGGGPVVRWDTVFEVLDPSQETAIVGMLDEYYQQTVESLRRKTEAQPDKPSGEPCALKGEAC